MLSSCRRSYQRLSEDFLLRAFATHQQGRPGIWRLLPAPPKPSTPPEKIEWWAVDGELFKAEKFDPKRVLAPLGNDHIPNRVRRKERIKHLGQTRLKLKVHGQESYWAAYMKRFQAMRDEWERHVWDPIPVPVPKPRNPKWVAEDSEKYVWKDPRRDAYNFDISRMDQSGARPRFDKKIGYQVQGMNGYPVDSRRDAGGSTFMRRDSYKDPRYGHQRSTDVGGRSSRQFEYDDFEDVFDAGNTTSCSGNATENRAHSRGHTQRLSLPTEDDKSDSGAEFSWDESESEESNGDYEGVKDKADYRSRGPPRKGWHRKEEDLFKDDD